VARLLGGAHLLLPKVAGTTSSLAIRIYDDEHEIVNHHQEDSRSTLDVFFQSFQMAVVFFILPQQEMQREQLDDPNSLFHYAQRVIRKENTTTVQQASSSRSIVIPKCTFSCRRAPLSSPYCLGILGFSLID
jgi:hypothetical protein